MIPGVGAPLLTATQLVVAALVILLFWDIGHVFHNWLEAAVSKVKVSID
jgi:hypothetical protein